MNKACNKFAIYGGGSWGSALAIKLAKSKYNVILYVQDHKIVDEINNNRTNSKYSPCMTFPHNITATTFVQDIFLREIIIIASPSDSFKQTIDIFKQYSLPKTTIILVATKGLMFNPVCLFSEYLQKEITNDFAFIYGPNFAQEVAEGLYSTATIGCGNLTIANNLAQLMQTENFIIDTTDDIITLQVAAVMKNIFAILSGIKEAEGVRENAKAALIVEALKEIKILSNAIGGKSDTLLTYGVLGDLVLTCYSKTSRNMKFGFEFTKAPNKKEFLEELSYLVEGQKALDMLIILAQQYNVSLPFIHSIRTILEQEN